MKKTLAALAVLSAFAGSAFAADVTLYGRIDTSILYTGTDTDVAGADRVNKVEMKNGLSTGSRFGIKGSEELGNGMKVGFILENGFNGDDGGFSQADRLFGREATLSLSGGFGTLYAGRMSTLACDGGSMALAGNMSAIGNAYGVITMTGSTGSAYARYDNLLGYVSPKFGGLQLSAQYSMGQKGQDENKATSDRYGAIGAKYTAGAFTGVVTAEYTVYGHGVGQDPDNGVAVQVGGNYNFDVAQLFVKAAYFDNQSTLLDTFDQMDGQFKGWGLELGAKVPAAGGTIFGAIGYRDAEHVDDSAKEFKRLSVGGGYSYAFSKRTNVYGAIGYAQEKNEANDRTPNAYNAAIGLVHKF